jgi:hypothetical protein
MLRLIRDFLSASGAAHRGDLTSEGEGAMGIVFFCQSCGARFEVAARMAGKKGHCKKCGQMMSIPRAEQLASMTSMPALAAAGVGSAGSAGPSIGGWLKSDAISAILAPITVDGMRFGTKKPSRFDDIDDSKPYNLAQPARTSNGAVRAPVGAALGFWMRQIGVLQKLFRSLNETAYLLSIPFIMIILAGIVTKSRSTALFGATFVVVLSVGRIVAGLAGLASVPLRSGLDTGKMKKPFRRVVEPIVTIALVVVAFTFIPWLSRGGAASKGTIAERLKANAKVLRAEMKGKVSKAADKAAELDLGKIGTEAQEKLKDVGDRVRGTSEEPRKSP